MKSKLKLISKKTPGIDRSPILRIDGLSKIFRVGTSYLKVLKDIRFSACSGELICILGRSGCGKTTLLNILAGFVPPSSGDVLLNGRPVTTPGSDRCVVFQEDTLFSWLTVEENIAFGFRNIGKKYRTVRTEVDRFVSMVGLSEFKDYLPKEISGGMKQRVALARVLILKPKILLMDEPFAALDAQTREEMQRLLLSLWEQFEITVVFVTHDVNEAVVLADRILLMEKAPGRIGEDIRVDLPRPRKRDSEDLLCLTRKLFDGLT